MINIHNTFSDGTGIAFTGNPIIFADNEEVDWGEYVPTHGYTLYVGPFELRYMPPVSIDVAEMVGAIVPTINEPTGDEEEILICIEGEATMRQRRLVNWQSDRDAGSFFAIPGGVSMQNAGRGNDIFASRFFDYGGQFFMTTRSGSWEIRFKRSEVSPLYFIFREIEMDSLSFKANGVSIEGDKSGRGIYALDVERLRSTFAEMSGGHLPDEIVVCYKEQPCTKIIVDPDIIAPEHTLVKFRNSFGVMEVVDLAGELTAVSALTDDEDKRYNLYDARRGRFVPRRDRPVMQHSLSVTVVPDSADRMRFLLDMVASDEVWLLNVDADPLRVIPTIDNLSRRARYTAPAPITINFDVADVNGYITPSLTEEGTRRKSTFDKTFNDIFI